MQLPKHEGLHCGSAFMDTNFNSWLVDIAYHNEFRLVSWPYPIHMHLFKQIFEL